VLRCGPFVLIMSTKCMTPCGDALTLSVSSIAMGDGSLDSACWRTSSFLVTGLWCRVQDVSDDEGEIIEINAATSAA
jgi:hypothetical protein